MSCPSPQLRLDRRSHERIMVHPGEQASLSRARSVGLPTVDESTAAQFSVAEIAAAPWRKSSWSSFNGSCVEVAELRDRICVRDTKAFGAGPILVFTPAEWNLLLSRIKRGKLDIS
jgi:hypothetical protein